MQTNSFVILFIICTCYTLPSKRHNREGNREFKKTEEKKGKVRRIVAKIQPKEEKSTSKCRIWGNDMNLCRI